MRLRRLCGQAARRQGDPGRCGAPRRSSPGRADGAGGRRRAGARPTTRRCWTRSRGWSSGRCRSLGRIDDEFMALPAEVAGRHDAGEPEIPDAAHRRRRAGAPLRHRRQHGGQRRRCRHRRRQRARAARPAVGRRVLLGPGPQGVAGEPPAGAGPDGVPRRAGLAGQRVERLVALAGALVAATCRVPIGRWPSARRCWPRPISSPAWWASSPSCRASWAATTPARRASPRRWPTPSATTTRPKAPTMPARRRPTSVVVALADKLDTLAGFFARRHPADRLQGPVRAAPRRARHHSADPGESACACRCGRRSRRHWPATASGSQASARRSPRS